ncbi:MAG: Na+/H+ antiporter subunit E [Rubrivivax sp.]|nr:Na+/H+ antiporter subunit E [Rubrivivax sp.]
MVHSISAFLSLYAFWLLLSGYFTPFLMTAGAACALAVVWFSHRMQVLDPEGLPVEQFPRSVPYWGWLLVEIVKSGWDVSRIIVDPRLPISPTMVRFKPSQQTAVGLVTHANSITLTPGTITVEADAGEFLVHALTRAGASGVVTGEMDARVRAIEGGR